MLDALPSLTNPTFYIVGNGAMIAELKRSLIAQGIDRKKHIRTEAFFDYGGNSRRARAAANWVMMKGPLFRACAR